MIIIPNSVKTIPEWVWRVSNKYRPLYTRLSYVWHTMGASTNDRDQEWVFAGSIDTKIFEDFNEAVLEVFKDFVDADIILVCPDGAPDTLFGKRGIVSPRPTECFAAWCEFGDYADVLDGASDDTEWCWDEVGTMQNAAAIVEECTHTTYHVDAEGVPLTIIAISPYDDGRSHRSGSAVDLNDLFYSGHIADVDLSAEELQGCIGRLAKKTETIHISDISNVRLFIAEDEQLILEATCHVSAKHTPVPSHNVRDSYTQVQSVLTTQYATLAKHLGHPVGTSTKTLEDLMHAGFDTHFLENLSDKSISVWFIKEGSTEGTHPIRITLSAKA